MAGLRGIDSVDGTVAWASGTGGTVLLTTDGGAHWQKCTTPDAERDGAALDFRGVQAWDAHTAIVMASGPGDKSRLYKTVNGCKTWKLIFRNPDAPNGFFDSFWSNERHGILVGDSSGVDSQYSRPTTAVRPGRGTRAVLCYTNRLRSLRSQPATA